MAYTTINKSSLHMNTKLYTGTGSSNAVTGVGFQPDLVWLKKRSGADNHYWFDAVRGATKYIRSNLTSAEATDAGSLSAFGSDGFTVVSEGDINANGATMASWNWKANGQGSSNTAGSINTTYTSVNTTSGFSIVKYSANNTAGATVGHGLGVIPKMIIVKELTGSINDWVVYHASVGNNKKLILNEVNAESIDNFMNNTTPTSTVFSISDASVVNRSGSTYMAYCFAEKQGYSKFGSYTGNGNADGTFIYTGFKPAFTLFKKTNATSEWFLYDNKRDGYNVTEKVFEANTNSAEDSNSGTYIDYLSNGFKLRGTSGNTNASGSTYIYMAFGQSIVGSSNVPCTAR